MLRFVAFAFALFVVTSKIATAQTAPVRYPPLEAEACRIDSSFVENSYRYDRKKRLANPIVAAQMGGAPDPRRYDAEIVHILGRSGRFVNWVGKATVTVHGNFVTVFFSIPCPVHNNADENLSAQLAFGTLSRNGTDLAPWESKALAMGYGDVPINGPLAQGLARVSSGGWVKMSGSLLYMNDFVIDQDPENPVMSKQVKRFAGFADIMGYIDPAPSMTGHQAQYAEAGSVRSQTSRYAAHFTAVIPIRR